MKASKCSGFSMTQYTGDNLVASPVEHNLGGVPDMVWVKNISNAVDVRWRCWFKGMTGSQNLILSESYNINTAGNSMANDRSWGATAWGNPPR